MFETGLGGVAVTLSGFRGVSYALLSSFLCLLFRFALLPFSASFAILLWFWWFWMNLGRTRVRCASVGPLLLGLGVTAQA